MSERLQRWELWEDGYDAVDVHMRKVRPAPGYVGEAGDEWCRAEEVSALEDHVKRVGEERDELLAVLRALSDV